VPKMICLIFCLLLTAGFLAACDQNTNNSSTADDHPADAADDDDNVADDEADDEVDDDDIGDDDILDDDLTPPGLVVTGQQWPEADQLFHQVPDWLGADAALSVDLGDERSLWLFGDTFVATSENHTRFESVMVHNTVAIQDGCDPLTADMAFYWRTKPSGQPGSFFREDGDLFHWPGHGLLAEDGRLIVFLVVEKLTPGQGLGFETQGWQIVVIDDATPPPDQWVIRAYDPPALPFDAIVGSAVVYEAPYLVAVARKEQGVHAGYLARFLMEDLIHGDFSSLEWWNGTEPGWVSTETLSGHPPVAWLADAGAECSLHHDDRLDLWLHVTSRGFGATTMAMDYSTSITGPYINQPDVYTPPESEGPNPFVYAARAHPELDGGDPSELVATYATNSFDFWDLFTPEGEQNLYWPRFVLLNLDLEQ